MTGRMNDRVGTTMVGWRGNVEAGIQVASEGHTRTRISVRHMAWTIAAHETMVETIDARGRSEMRPAETAEDRVRKTDVGRRTKLKDRSAKGQIHLNGLRMIEEVREEGRWQQRMCGVEVEGVDEPKISGEIRGDSRHHCLVQGTRGGRGGMKTDLGMTIASADAVDASIDIEQT